MATEILRPNAAGDETSIPSQYPNSTYHWDKVDEAEADDATTYIYAGQPDTYYRDLYNLPAHSIGFGTINSITIYFRIGGQYGVPGYGKPSQKSGATVTDGTEQSQATDTWATKSQTYTTNPATGNAYTWEEIDALQVGVSLSSGGYSYTSRCTQVYVVVDYTAVSAPTVSTQAVDGIGFD